MSTRIHGMLDHLTGGLLLLSPWLFGPGAFVQVPHFEIGGLEIGAALTTETVPSPEAVSSGY